MLRFSCLPGCTKCCQVRGYVYLTEEDLRRAAAYVGLTAEAFEAKYVIRYPTLLRLRKPTSAQCHFLTASGCSIHEVKPTQCRLYPFWPELVEQRAAWQEAGNECPGIGQGELIQIGTALETANGMKVAYPSMYFEE